MFFVPTWVTNFILLITCWLSGSSIVQIAASRTRVTNMQFGMMVFCAADGR